MKHVLLFVVCAILFGGCVKNNPLPVWIEINEWTIQANPNSQNDPGYLTHNFTDAWVYVDNELIGVFEVPCKIPVLASGDNKSIRVYPTIRNNGLHETKKIYPFCEPYEVTQNLVPGETVTLNPTTRYYSNCEFWLEDFESSSVKITTNEDDSNTDMTFENDSQMQLDGKYGHIAFTASDSIWVGITNQTYLPGSAAEVYLEIDYRTTVPISVNTIAVLSDNTNTPNYMATITASTQLSDWKKIYIDLKEFVSYSVNAVGFKQSLTAIIPEGNTVGDIYIDNIRLVHF